MYRGNSSRVVPILLVLIVIAIAIAALVSVGRAVFGGNDQETQSQIDVGRDALLNTTLGRSVRMTVRGPIVADESFRSYQVLVDPSERTMTTYAGYLSEPLDSKTYSNNAKAYEEFVYALDKANLMKGVALTGDKDDIRGICASGNIYEFEVLKDNKVVKRLWTSTCKGSVGSLKASVKQVESLFHKQIPESKTVLRTIDL